MCLKADYYTGLGSNMHAAYNVQAMVVRGLVLSCYVSSSRTDIRDFIPVMNIFHDLYGDFPKNVCADSGYGSLENNSKNRRQNVSQKEKNERKDVSAGGEKVKFQYIKETLI